MKGQSESMKTLKRLTEAEIAIEGGIYEQINFVSKGYESIQTVLPASQNVLNSEIPISNQPQIGPRVSQII